MLIDYPWRDNLQAILNYLDKYSAQIFVLQMGLLVILTGIILWVYFYNRKKYHNLKHQIPASVVKNYLDSIIQNSTALKSSLFRGGGLDVDTNGIPSVVPVGQMESMGQVGISLDNVQGDDALKAEVARLQSQLADKRNVIQDLEKNSKDLEGQVSQKQERIIELEALLAKGGSLESGSGASSEELTSLKTENDLLKEELDQYAMIGDDLADLKRLKQENAQLKSALNAEDLDDIASGLSSDDEDEVEETEDKQNDSNDLDDIADELSTEDKEDSEDETEEEEVVADANVEATSEDEEEEVVAASAEEKDKVPDKSPEDLLSEFEKMLG